MLAAGKDYFTDKGPFTTLEQLAATRAAVADSGRKYLVYYGERLHNAPTWEACELVRGGAIGRVLQVLVLAPHNLDNESRPPWFYDKSRTGGILTDIGSHQFEQFLYVAGAAGGRVNYARAANLGHPEHPGLEDFGEASVTLDNGASAYCRVDWFNPRASRTWGDGRAFILGSDGYVEVRKNVDAGNPAGGPCVILVNHDEERTITFDGGEPFPFFGRMILDCLHRTEGSDDPGARLRRRRTDAAGAGHRRRPRLDRHRVARRSRLNPLPLTVGRCGAVGRSACPSQAPQSAGPARRGPRAGAWPAADPIRLRAAECGVAPGRRTDWPTADGRHRGTTAQPTGSGLRSRRC